MSNIETKNAVIESTTLGYEGHGIFSAYLQLSYGGSGQSFGGYAMDEYVGVRGERGARIGTAYGMDFIIAVMKTVGVESWEDLKGKHIRVTASSDKVHSIGHFLEDRWFDPSTLAGRATQ